MAFFNKNRTYWGVIFFMLLLVVIMIVMPSGGQNGEDTEQSPTADSSPSPDSSVSAETSPSPEISPTPPAGTYSGPDVAERDPVDDDYFSDAAFMGNSLVDGFRLFSGLTTCDYYAATSMTVVAATNKYCITLDNGASGTLVDGLIQKPYGKIYILLGINEIGYDVDTFGQYYTDMLNTIIAAQPDCDIYIMGLTPVSYAKSSSSDLFNMERIGQYNEKLRSIAEDEQCYYIDLVAALSGDDGYLPSSETSDGVHFSASVYIKWLDYLKTHYVHDPEYADE